jgi:hypothetical protein
MHESYNFIGDPDRLLLLLYNQGQYLFYHFDQILCHTGIFLLMSLIYLLCYGWHIDGTKHNFDDHTNIYSQS